MDRHPHADITVGSFFEGLVKFIKWSAVFAVVCFGGLWLVVPTFRHNVRTIEGPGPQPTDCDFMTAPLGNKGCHYEMDRELMDAQGRYIATVNWFDTRTKADPANADATPVKMVCSWVRVQD